MIIVHDVFICKPGNASKIAKLFKEWADVVPKKNVNVMTDLTGQYHRVVVASSFQNLTACEEEQKVMEKFKDMNEMYVSGSREIFKVCKMAVHNSSHPCNDSSIFSMKFFLKIK